jgi:hypothetical protein
MQTAMAGSVLPLREKQMPLRVRPGIAQLQPKESAAQLMVRAAKTIAAASHPQLTG